MCLCITRRPSSDTNRRLLNWKGRRTVIRMVRSVGLCTDGVSRRTRDLVTKVMCKCWQVIGVIIKLVIISLIICLLFLMFLQIIGEGCGVLFNKSHSIPRERTILSDLLTSSTIQLENVFFNSNHYQHQGRWLIYHLFFFLPWFSTGFLWSFFFYLHVI